MRWSVLWIGLWIGLAALASACGDDSAVEIDGSMAGCLEDRDCQGGEACRAGVCRQACSENRDCAGGELCVNSVCVTVCGDDDDCGDGEICDPELSQCRAVQCTEDADCRGGQRCQGNRCTEIGADGGMDATLPNDATLPFDSPLADSSRVDSAISSEAGPDGTAHDGAASDSTTNDGAAMDATTDSSAGDSSVPDASVLDSGLADTGTPDARSCTANSCGVTQRCCNSLCANREVPRGAAGRDDSSFQHCGSCGAACDVDRASACSRPMSNSSPTCMCGNSDACSGDEVCVPNETSFACTDLDDDENNCGSVGLACDDGEECIAGECRCGVSPACADGQACCADECRDVTSDVNNCGECNLRCGGQGDRCVDSTCRCGSAPACEAPVPGFPLGGSIGELCCGGDAPTCIAQSESNCGGCGVMCISGSSCLPPLFGTESCCSNGTIGCDLPFP